MKPITKKTMLKKTFDCMAYKAAVQSEIQTAIQGKSNDAQLAFLKQQAESGTLGPWWKKSDCERPQGGGTGSVVLLSTRLRINAPFFRRSGGTCGRRLCIPLG